MDYSDMRSSLDQPSQIESLLCGELPARTRVEDEFVDAHVRRFAQRIGCSSDNVVAAVAWSRQFPTSVAITAGEKRAQSLRDRQRPHPHYTPPCAA